MAKFNAERTVGKINDIRGNIESTKNVLDSLESEKEKVLDAITDIKGSNIDEETEKMVTDTLNQKLESISEQGKEASEGLNKELENLEDIKEETQDALDDNRDQIKRMEDKQSALEKLGLSGVFDAPIEELEASSSQLENIKDSINDAEKEADEIGKKLDML